MKKKYFCPNICVHQLKTTHRLMACSVGNIANMRIATEEDDEIESTDNIW